MKKKWIKIAIAICLAVILVVTGTFFGYKYLTKSKKNTNKNFMTAVVTKGTLDVTVPATGTVSSTVSKDIVAQNNGTLSLNVKEGDTVKKGDVLGKIDDSNAQEALKKAQSNLTQQNLNLTKLKNSLNDLYVKSPVSGTVKAVNISAGDDVSQQSKVFNNALVTITYTDGTGKTVDLPVSTQSGKVAQVYVQAGSSVNKGDNLFRLNGDDVNNSITMQNLSVQQAQQDLTDAQNSVNNATITSPFDGVVAAVDFNNGDTVQNGKTVFTIMNPSQMQTVVQVDELDISKVNVGQKASITLDAIADKTFSGEVSKIATLGKTTNNVTTYDVTLSIDSPDGVKVGMTTNANISTQSKSDVLMLPIEAVQGSGNNRYVLVSNNSSKKSSSSKSSQAAFRGNGQGGYGQGGYGQRSGNGQGGGFSGRGGFSSNSQNGDVSYKRVMVKTGIMNENYIEITDGVTEREKVLIPVATASNTNTTQRASNVMGGSGFGGFGGGFGGGGSGSSKKSK